MATVFVIVPFILTVSNNEPSSYGAVCHHPLAACWIAAATYFVLRRVFEGFREKRTRYPISPLTPNLGGAVSVGPGKATTSNTSHLKFQLYIYAIIQPSK